MARIEKSINLLSFRMFAVLKFFVFNSALSTADVLTDLLTYLALLDNNPNWAGLTLYWMWNPFVVHSAIFLFNKAFCKRGKTSNTIQELMHEFYKQAGVHLPFVASVHNIWRTHRLYQLKYGTEDFNSKDHKEVEKLLDEAGRCSQAESNLESGPQSVTQVLC